MKKTIFILCILLILNACTREKAQTSASPANAGRDHALIARAEITPVNATSTTPLVMQYSSKDPGESAVQYRFRWHVDGSVISEATDNLLDPSFFTKGSQVEGEIVPVVNNTEAESYRTAPVTIANTAPVLTAAELPSTPVFSGDSITVTAQGSDADKNDTVSFLYQWEVNGRPVAGAESRTFDTAGLKKKTFIAVVVTPFDGEAKGTALRSPSAVVISNRNPEIISDPPSGLSGGVYTYQVTARDQDGDAITYRLITAPPGMTIDRAGMVRWEAPRQVPKPQDVPVKVAADDGDGGLSYQEFSLFLESK